MIEHNCNCIAWVHVPIVCDKHDCRGICLLWDPMALEHVVASVTKGENGTPTVDCLDEKEQNKRVLRIYISVMHHHIWTKIHSLICEILKSTNIEAECMSTNAAIYYVSTSTAQSTKFRWGHMQVEYEMNLHIYTTNCTKKSNLCTYFTAIIC